MYILYIHPISFQPGTAIAYRVYSSTIGSTLHQARGPVAVRGGVRCPEAEPGTKSGEVEAGGKRGSETQTESAAHAQAVRYQPRCHVNILQPSSWRVLPIVPPRVAVLCGGDRLVAEILL